jgi:hypothetical protein
MSENNQPGPAMISSPDLKPVYANLVRIGHTPMELVFDFACMFPGQPQSQILSRVIMAPLGAKLFLQALTENLARYEAAFGEINLPGGDSNLAGSLFKGINPHG